MSNSPAVPRSKRNGYAYLAARARIENQILQLAKACGISLSVEVDLDPAPSEDHQIQLTYGRSRRIVAVDHETFVDEEFFRTLVLHQLQATIQELASVVDLSPSRTRTTEGS